MVEVDFKNIQCLKEGKITIKRNAINIKYGYNGIGKTSIGKAIEYTINADDEKISFLEPYTGGEPEITISESFNGCFSFNSETISNFLFQETDLIANPYEVFFTSKDFQSKEVEIENMLSDLKESLMAIEITEFLNVGIDIDRNIKFNAKKNSLNRKVGYFGKGVVVGVDVTTKMVTDLPTYSRLIISSNKQKWAKWFSDGTNYIIDDLCPFCNQKLDSTFSIASEKIAEYNSNVDFAKNKQAMELLETIEQYSSISCKREINSLRSLKDDFGTNEIKILEDSITPINKEMYKIIRLKEITSNKNNSSDDIKEMNTILDSLKLDDDYFVSTGNKELTSSVKKINKSIEKLILNIKDYCEEIEKYNALLSDSITEAYEEINNFLTIAGIPYLFKLKPDEETGEYHTYLSPIDKKDKEMSDPTEKLSYGEQNALALVLFAAIASRKDDELIIIDDPVSSFDENKKFAILYYLFNKTTGILRNKTVLILTHDMWPLLDIINKHLVEVRKKTASLLVCSNGKLYELPISGNDIQNTISYERFCALKESNNYLKIVHLRKYYEMLGMEDNKNVYDLLSSAEKRFKHPLVKIDGQYIPMSNEDKSKAIEQIRKDIKDFEYETFVEAYESTKTLIDMYKCSSSKISKLILARQIFGDISKSGNDRDTIIFNFISQQYHIENLYLYTIKGFDNIPQYIISFCDELVNKKELELINL